MIDVKKTFDNWSKLNCLDLRTELPGCEFDCKVDGIFYFRITNPDTLVDILTLFLGDYTYGNNNSYHYKDGTIAKFIKVHKWYEFKKYKNVIARIRID